MSPGSDDDWRAGLAGDAAVDVARLDKALGVRLRDRALVTALLDPRGRLFQRLEYVGDSLLDAVVVRELVRLEPWDAPDLSSVSDGQRALVSDHALGRVAARRGLPDVRAFDASAHRLGDRVEATVGAAWADAGLAAAEAVARRLVVDPGLAERPRVAGVPEAEPDPRVEAAARTCGHEPVTAAWFGAAAVPGPVRRRLAAVGNAVVEAACSTAQYVEEPDASEAVLSEERRRVTSNAALARRARTLRLPAAHERGDVRAAADTAQALVGAVTMDGGLLAGLLVASRVLGRAAAPGPVDLAARDASAP